MAANSNLIPLSALPGLMKRGEPDRAPWRQPGEINEYLHIRGALAVPAAGSTDQIVTSFKVQTGYAAVVTDVLFMYSGATAGAFTPPIEGDATSLYYSLRIDGQLFARNFEQITTTLGSITHGPYPLRGGLQLKAGQLLEGLVTVPAASGISTGAPNYILCHLLGWQWPTS